MNTDIMRSKEFNDLLTFKLSQFGVPTLNNVNFEEGLILFELNLLLIVFFSIFLLFFLLVSIVYLNQIISLVSKDINFDREVSTRSASLEDTSNSSSSSSDDDNSWEKWWENNKKYVYTVVGLLFVIGGTMFLFYVFDEDWGNLNEEQFSALLYFLLKNLDVSEQALKIPKVGLELIKEFDNEWPIYSYSQVEVTKDEKDEILSYWDAEIREKAKAESISDARVLGQLIKLVINHINVILEQR